MKIVPAVLAEKFDDFLVRLRQAEAFADYIQIDIMDGDFVPTRSFPPESLNSVSTALSFEIHLMVRDPIEVVSRLSHPALKKAIFHCESDGDHSATIETIRERGLSVGLAVKPGTGIEQFRESAGQVDTLLFLTVDPCCYGNPFKPEVLDKVVEARKIFPNKTIAVDGAVSLENLDLFLKSGIDYVCVGSRIFLQGDPAENYRHFVKKLKGL